MNKDYYSILGVSRDADEDEIKKAYRRQAAKHHPDRGGSTEKFQEIEEAYRTLSDPVKRQQHDNPVNQENPFGGGFSGGFPGFSFNFGGGGNPFDDMFSQMFRQQHEQQRTQIYRTIIWITLEQVFSGGDQTIRLQTQNKTHMVKISIPLGVMDGGQVRYDSVIDGASLIVEFRVHPHLKFERRHHDLYCNQSISVLDLIVGTEFEFTSIDGNSVSVVIPPTTQPSSILKIAGRGLPINNTSSRGDQYIILKPFVPTDINPSIIAAIKG